MSTSLEDCPCCLGSGKVSIATYMKYGGSAKCFACSGIGQMLVLDKAGEES